MAEYQAWIDKYYPTQQIAYGKCAEATLEMCATFPELTRRRGHYLCIVWGEREHWWCEAPDGTIVDPTRRQFPSQSGHAYRPWDESQPEPTGMCPNCGDLCYDGGYLCSRKCEVQYAAYCSGGSHA
jgi:hypothetical protein